MLPTELPKPFSMFQRANLPAPWTVLVIGEAPGADEEKIGVPFVGPSGDLFNELATIVGFERKTIRDKNRQPIRYDSQFDITNVFSQRPPNNDLERWTLNKTELKAAGFSDVGRLPQIRRRYLHPAYEPEVARLHDEIAQLKPDLIIALGGTALWALTGDFKITQARGNFFFPSNPITGEQYTFPAIASFHPAAILRKYDDRPILWADLAKAKGLLDGTLPAPLQRVLYLDPTFEEMEHVWNIFASEPSRIVGVDIETDPRIDQITSISFATSDLAICIPFWYKYALPDEANSWPTVEEEVKAWGWVRRFGQLSNPKAGQNWLYDMQYLLEPLDIRIICEHDTAILQHSMQPELPKALGFLASIYLNEPSWKFLRHASKDDNKADD